MQKRNFTTYSRLVEEETWNFKIWPKGIVRGKNKIKSLSQKKYLTHIELEELIVLRGDREYVTQLRQKAVDLLEKDGFQIILPQVVPKSVPILFF